MNINPTLYLYSASPRRGALLKRIGIKYSSFPVDADESIPDGYSSDEIVLRIAMRKLSAGIAAEASHSEVWGLAADTLVEGPDGLLGKPENKDEAVDMLRSLSGICHMVHTGIAVYSPTGIPDGEIRSQAQTTMVEFRNLSEQEIDDYIEYGEWKGVAGAYRIQERGSTLVKRIDGLWSTVVGLPLSTLYGILSAMSYPFGLTPDGRVTLRS